MSGNGSSSGSSCASAWIRPRRKTYGSTVDCAHRKIKMPDGSTQDFSPTDPGAVHEPATPVPPPVPWEDRFDDCCKVLQPQDRMPKVELIDDESCIFKDGGTWYFKGHIR